MAVNIPANYEPLNFTFGPGVLSLVALTVNSGTVTEATDLVEIGGQRSGATFAVTRTRLDVNQGSPITLVKQFVTQEEATLTVNGIEWDLDKLRLALGAGVVVTAGNPDTFGFGGDLNIVECAAKYVHVMPSGYTLSLRIWRAQGAGELNVTFGDDLHEIPYSFRALQATQKWGGTTLGTKEQLFQITLTK